MTVHTGHREQYTQGQRREAKRLTQKNDGKTASESGLALNEHHTAES